MIYIKEKRKRERGDFFFKKGKHALEALEFLGGWKRGDSWIVGRRSTKGLEKRAIATKAAQV